ncbi:hypothetical protein KJ616_00930, partial [Patescibacteria group bacterium]|nr:hypothetical protein [Patescibacteria group bacterium]
MAGVNFFLKKERVFFFRGSALQVFGQCVGLQCGLGFAKTIFWGKGFGKTSAEFSRPQKGVWGMNAGGIPISLFFKIVAIQ